MMYDLVDDRPRTLRGGLGCAAVWPGVRSGVGGRCGPGFLWCLGWLCWWRCGAWGGCGGVGDPAARPVPHFDRSISLVIHQIR